MVLSAPTYQYSIATPGCIHGPSGPYLLSGKTAGMSAHILYSGSEIHYKIAGAGSAVVLLHGFGEDSSIWSNQVEHLKDNFKLIIPDLPGSGRSEKIQINRPSSPESDPEIANTSEIPEEVTLETYAAIIKKILEKENIARCVMIGHSMGGYITLAFAEMYPHTLQGLGLFHSSAYADTTDKITTRLKAIEFIKENGVAAFFNTSIPTLFGERFKEQQPGKIDAVGHRIVHGGARFYEPTRIDAAVLNEIHALTALAPLHNPSGLAGIEAVKQALPDVPNVAVFDTAFHHRLPEVAARYALPSALSERLQLRRYGFHGISYRYVSERLTLLLQDGAQQVTRLIICHLGNGASVCALREGQSIDTSMGFTPLEGLIMGNRSGDVDPGLLLHLLHSAHMTPDQLNDLLNHQSGLLGLSGKSSDVRDLEKAASTGDPASRLALDCFAYRVRKYIGAYAVALGGIDNLVFTGGIGERSASMRVRICHDLDFLGLYLDPHLNQTATGTEPAAISDDARSIWIVPTDEERQIARETFTLLSYLLPNAMHKNQRSTYNIRGKRVIS